MCCASNAASARKGRYQVRATRRKAALMRINIWIVLAVLLALLATTRLFQNATPINI